MTISLPPTAPSRQDPATFSDRADAFAAWLVSAVPQFNDLAVGSNDSGNFQNITVAGQITGNAVTQSSTDTTAGRVPVNRAGGIFGVGALADVSGKPSGGYDSYDNSIPSGMYRHGSSASGAPTTDNGVALFMRRSNTFGGMDGGVVHMRIPSDPNDVQAWIAAGRSEDPAAFKELYHTGNTTVDSNGFVKEASPIVRLFDDGTQEPVQPVGAQFERLGVGEYRLSDVEPLAETGWQVEVPQDGNGNRLVFVSTEYDPEARTLTVITSAPAWDGGWVAGEPKDIPEGRWVDLRFKPLPKPEEEGDA